MWWTWFERGFEELKNGVERELSSSDTLQSNYSSWVTRRSTRWSKTAWTSRSASSSSDKAYENIFGIIMALSWTPMHSHCEYITWLNSIGKIEIFTFKLLINKNFEIRWLFCQLGNFFESVSKVWNSNFESVSTFSSLVIDTVHWIAEYYSPSITHWVSLSCWLVSKIEFHFKSLTWTVHTGIPALVSSRDNNEMAFAATTHFAYKTAPWLCYIRKPTALAYGFT